MSWDVAAERTKLDPGTPINEGERNESLFS